MLHLAKDTGRCEWGLNQGRLRAQSLEHVASGRHTLRPSRPSISPLKTRHTSIFLGIMEGGLIPSSCHLQEAGRLKSLSISVSVSLSIGFPPSARSEFFW